MVQAGLAASEITDLLAARREEVRRAVLDRFEKATVDGDLPAGTDCPALARYVLVTAEGLAVHAATGAPRTELLTAAVLAAQVVPAGLTGVR